MYDDFGFFYFQQTFTKVEIDGSKDMYIFHFNKYRQIVFQ